jgi:hypothetical protein
MTTLELPAAEEVAEAPIDELIEKFLPILPTEKLVEAYLHLRNEISARKEAFEAEIAQVEERFEAIAGKLLETCNAVDADTLRTKAGTISRRISVRYWTSDWEKMHEFVRDHQALDLLERRIHTGNMKQFLEENPDLHPEGLQVERTLKIQVRKPTNK